jgi:hypothetical protein
MKKYMNKMLKKTREEKDEKMIKFFEDVLSVFDKYNL